MPADEPRVVYHLRNRTVILVAGPLVAAYSAARLVENLRCGEAWVNWLAGLLVWLILCVLALRRRLEFAPGQLEYVESFGAIRVPWAQITGVASRKMLGLWRAEGLECWTARPGLKKHFIDLTQFDPAWRQHELGRLLQARAPQAFKRSAG